MKFPINLNEYKQLKFLTTEDLGVKKNQLIKNIKIVRDSIVFFTAYANAKGLGGHTGGAFDIVPEILILDGFMKGNENIIPIFYDEAGHRVAIQYIMAVLNGYIKEESLFHYREYNKGLYGHPEREDKKGIFFSSGRLGHMWGYVNGVAIANPNKVVVMFGSDGAMQEGNDAEAARFCAANNLNVKIVVDDNNVTIAGHPSEYMKKYEIGQTLTGQGIKVNYGDGENIEELYERIQNMLKNKGPYTLINKRVMAPGIKGIENSPKGHDVIAVDLAINYLEHYPGAIEILKKIKPTKKSNTYLGSTAEKEKNRDVFGKFVNDLIRKIPDRKEKILVVDSDLEGSCGLHHIKKEFPEIYINGGIMERNNFSVCAGFGSSKGKQGIFGTFSAFSEMLISEITMARLNNANVLAHFSHSGVDDMADNSCHFGINNFFVDNGIGTDNTRLYFPADAKQMQKIIDEIFYDNGLRFIFSTRSAVPYILDVDGKKIFDDKYHFSGDDEIIREGRDGYIISYGEMLYRSLDAVEQLKKEGIELGLINKPVLNVIDKKMMKKLSKSKYIVVVESQNIKTGLGSKFGTWLLDEGFFGKYMHLGVDKPGKGGLDEQINNQGLDSQSIMNTIRGLL